MARHLFGGSAADVAEDISGARVPNATGTVWNGSRPDATQITDLLDEDGNPTQTLTSDDQGMVRHFYGPDNVTLLYVDFGAGRVALVPVNTSTDLASHLNATDPHGAKQGAVDEITAQKGAPGGIATLDNNGKVPATQLPALSGDSSGGSHWLNIKNNPYGAKGDGVSDDTTAILTAIEDAVYGDVIYFPPGVYVISQPIDLYKRGVTLRGSHSNLMVGPGMVGAEWACYIQAAPTFTTGAMITITGDDSDGNYPAINGEHRIENLMLDGSKVPTGSLDGVYAKGNVQNVVLRDVCIRQMPNNGIVTASNAGDEWPYSWRLHSVMVDNCHANGIMMERNTDLTLEDCQVIGCWSSGIKLSNCANTIITHSRAEWNGNYGFHIFGGWGNWPGSGSMTMTGCSTDRNGWDGVRIDASGNGPFLVSALNTRRDGRNGGPGGGGYAGLRLSGTAPVVVTNLGCYVGTDDGGTAGTSPDYGVHITGARDVSLDSAYLHGALEGIYTAGGNGRVHIGSAVTTVKGNNFSEDRVAGKAYATGSPTSYDNNGIYLPAGWGSRWKTKRDAAATGKARIVVVGGSSSQGFHASHFDNTSWVGRVRQGLQSKYGDGGSGAFVASRSGIWYNNSTTTPIWVANGSFATFTGIWSTGANRYGPGVAYVTTDRAGATMTYTVRGTSVHVYYLEGNTPSATRAPFTITVDGGAPLTVTPPPTGDSAVKKASITGLPAGTHTVVIAWAGTIDDNNEFLSVCSVSGENEQGIIVDNLAKSGATSAYYATTTTPGGLNSEWNGGSGYPADLVIYTAAPNDANDNVSPDVWSKNVAKYLAKVRAVDNGATDIMIMLPHLGKHDVSNFVYHDYSTRGRGLAEAFGAAFVNMWAIGRNSWEYWNSLGYWGNSTSPGAVGTDNVHPSDAGHQFMADQILPLLAN